MPNSPQGPAKDVITIDHAWIMRGKELIECRTVVLDSIHNNIVFSDTTKGDVTIPFEAIDRIVPEFNLRIPAVTLRMKNKEEVGIYFVIAAKDIKTLSKQPLKVLALGEPLAAATSGMTAFKSSYGQILNDKVNIMERWLKYHKVAAYRRVLDRNSSTSLILGVGILGLVILFAILVPVIAPLFNR